MLAPCLQALVSVLPLALQRFIVLHYEQSKPCASKLANILQFADFIRLQAHRSQLLFSDKLWNVRNELGFTHAETPLPTVFLDCVSRNGIRSGHTETNVSFSCWNRYWGLCNRWDSAHKQITDFKTRWIYNFQVFIKYPTNMNYYLSFRINKCA